MLEKEIRDLEERLLTPEVRRSRQELERLIASDFLEHGSSGRTFDREALIEELERVSPFVCTLEEFAVRRLSAEVVLAVYTARSVIAGATTMSLRSSVWVHRQDRWQLAFHQGTWTSA